MFCVAKLDIFSPVFEGTPMVNMLLTEEERMLQAAVREFAEAELMPRAREMDEKEEFSWDVCGAWLAWGGRDWCGPCLWGAAAVPIARWLLPLKRYPVATLLQP